MRDLTHLAAISVTERAFVRGNPVAAIPKRKADGSHERRLEEKRREEKRGGTREVEPGGG